MRNLQRRARETGFTLIEIMIGFAIGVVGVLVMFQTVAVWNKHSQTTMAGGDADVAGTLAIFNLERDLRLGGFGFGTADVPIMGCTVEGTDTATARTLSFPLTPIEIVEHTDGSDEINVLHGSSAFFVSGERVISSTATSKSLARRNGFKQGD